MALLILILRNVVAARWAGGRVAGGAARRIAACVVSNVEFAAQRHALASLPARLAGTE